MKNNSALLANLKSGFVAVTIPVVVILSFVIYQFMLGNPDNFQGGDPVNHPIPGNYLGIIYKGGFIVPILLSLLFLVLIFAVERFLTLHSAKGNNNLRLFVSNVKEFVNTNQLEKAIVACDHQKGSVASVIKAGLEKSLILEKNYELDPEKKVLSVKKDMEEATQLELPSIEKNLVIIATIASIATLMGLLGTVLGMIKAFAALATAGAPDAVALANGISEALINTALGIGTSAIAIVMYNFFTTKIDALIHSIDEAGYTITQKMALRDHHQLIN
ncbi:MAG: MotA/TolQ/ExbB proton channel family protein [Imperialibacter sp.]|uniref:MotA/TolQ/ExbB proton channel family protein n=1 Tax=Imperialibacter sp. TaxID=2038411 RepID=UPI0032EC961C